MSGWTSAELSSIGGADELGIAGLRRDGTLRKVAIVWLVRVGDDLYVRSGYGHTAAWYRGTKVLREGQISAGGVVKHVAFQEADAAANNQVDDAYRNKYSRFGAQYINSVTTEDARSTTLRILPR